MFPINHKCRRKVKDFILQCDPKTKEQMVKCLARFARQEGITIQEAEVCYYCLVSTGEISLIE